MIWCCSLKYENVTNIIKARTKSLYENFKRSHNLKLYPELHFHIIDFGSRESLISYPGVLVQGRYHVGMQNDV